MRNLGLLAVVLVLTLMALRNVRAADHLQPTESACDSPGTAPSVVDRRAPVAIGICRD